MVIRYSKLLIILIILIIQGNLYAQDIPKLQRQLNKGNYEIFIYSDCVSCPKGQDSLIKVNVTIENRSEEVDLGIITIANFI